jgi:hypothetical protein
MSITEVKVNNVVLDLTDVRYAVKVTHGRSDVASTPEPSQGLFEYDITGSATLPIALGDELVIKAYNVTRFTGLVTDIELAHDQAPPGADARTFVVVTAMGTLARLSRFFDGSTGFPAQSVQDRVDTILTNTGLTYTAEADPALRLIAYTGEETDVATLLANICDSTGATVFDTPNGDVYFESYTRRGYSYSTARWQDYTIETWADIVDSWDSQYVPGTSAPSLVTIPGVAVAWEPSWRTTDSTIINAVTVGYGTNNPQDTTYLDDTNSIATYDIRQSNIQTDLETLGDADRRAQLIITAQSVERWQLGTITVLLDAVPTHQLRDDILALQEGARVLITDLPEPNPTGTSQFLGVVEGWAEEYIDGVNTMGLSLSDPRFSYATVSWGEAPSTATWGGVPNTKTWADIIVPADLI